MNQRYLEVTYRKGKPLAAYLYLPRVAGDTSVHTERPAPGLVIDYSADRRPIGIEITAPGKVTLAGLNQVLVSVGQNPATADELAPVLAGRLGTAAPVNE